MKAINFVEFYDFLGKKSDPDSKRFLENVKKMLKLQNESSEKLDFDLKVPRHLLNEFLYSRKE